MNVKGYIFKLYTELSTLSTRYMENYTGDKRCKVETFVLVYSNEK